MCILQVILFKTYCVILCHVYTIINQVDNQCACENKIWKNKAYNRKQRKTKQINCHCHHCQSSRKSVWSVDIRKRLIWTTISQLISHIGVVLQLTFFAVGENGEYFPIPGPCSVNLINVFMIPEPIHSFSIQSSQIFCNSKMCSFENLPAFNDQISCIFVTEAYEHSWSALCGFRRVRDVADYTPTWCRRKDRKMPSSKTCPRLTRVWCCRCSHTVRQTGTMVYG